MIDRHVDLSFKFQTKAEREKNNTWQKNRLPYFLNWKWWKLSTLLPDGALFLGRNVFWFLQTITSWRISMNWNNLNEQIKIHKPQPTVPLPRTPYTRKIMELASYNQYLFRVKNEIWIDSKLKISELQYATINSHQYTDSLNRDLLF